MHRHESDGEEEFIASQTKNVLGDGELSREYARVVEQRRVISEEMHADSIQKDVQYAAELLAAEQAALAKQLEEQHEIARRDAEFAQRISASQETEPLSSSTNKRHREALSEDAPTEIQPPKKKSGSGPASVGISAWLSRSSSTGPVVGSSGGRVVNMSPSEGPFAYAPSLKRKIDAKEGAQNILF